jgi:hypothetical protein
MGTETGVSGAAISEVTESSGSVSPADDAAAIRE